MKYRILTVTLFAITTGVFVDKLSCSDKIISNFELFASFSIIATGWLMTIVFTETS